MQLYKKNERLVRYFSENEYFTYSQGQKDAWYVNYYCPDGHIYNPLDKEYMKSINDLACAYSKKKVYKDYLKIYDLVTKNAIMNNRRPVPLTNDFTVIDQIVATYAINDQHLISILYHTFYLTMISEWYYLRGRLQHSVKNLAVHQILFENMTPLEVAQYSKGKKWRDLYNDMLIRNIDVSYIAI